MNDFKILYQVLIALGNGLVYIIIFNLFLTIREKRISGAFAEIHMWQKKIGVGETSIKASTISHFTNISITTALFLTIEFGVMQTSGTANSFVSMSVFLALLNSVATTVVTLSVAIQMVVCLSGFDENGIVEFFLSDHKRMGYVVKGYSLIGWTMVGSDVSNFWLFTWLILWMVNNMNNVVCMTLSTGFGYIYIQFVQQESYNNYFAVVKKFEQKYGKETLENYREVDVRGDASRRVGAVAGDVHA